MEKRWIATMGLAVVLTSQPPRVAISFEHFCDPSRAYDCRAEDDEASRDNRHPRPLPPNEPLREASRSTPDYTGTAYVPNPLPGLRHAGPTLRVPTYFKLRIS
jgi:hypothetical protein